MLTAEISLNATGKQSTALDLGTATLPFSLSVAYSLTDGVAAGQADRVFTDTRTLGPSATENLDLAGVLTDAFGALITFATIKAVIVRARKENTNDVQVTRPATNGVPIFMVAGGGVALAPGEVFAKVRSGAGIPVVPATGDLIAVTNSAAGTPVTYDVIVIGTSV
jgi:hypothetical protein